MYIYKLRQDLRVKTTEVDDAISGFSLVSIDEDVDEGTTDLTIECIFFLDYSLAQALATDPEKATNEVLDQYGCEEGELEDFEFLHLNGNLVETDD